MFDSCMRTMVVFCLMKQFTLLIKNYENIHCDEFLELLQTISELIDELYEDSEAFSKNTEWTTIQKIDDCRMHKNQVMTILSDRKLIAQRHTAPIVISNFEGLGRKLDLVYQSIVLYQQTRQTPRPDAGSVQETLLRWKGGVGDCIRYIEKTFSLIMLLKLLNGMKKKLKNFKTNKYRKKLKTIQKKYYRISYRT